MKARRDFLTDSEYAKYQREYYAGLAMQGLMFHKDTQTTDDIVMMSVKVADALIQELYK